MFFMNGLTEQVALLEYRRIMLKNHGIKNLIQTVAMSHQSSFPPMHSAWWCGLSLSEKRGLQDGQRTHTQDQTNKQTIQREPRHFLSTIEV